MACYFLLVLLNYCTSANNYVSSYDKISLKFCASFRFFPCSIHVENPKNPLSELCEKENRNMYHLHIDGHQGTKFNICAVENSQVNGCTSCARQINICKEIRPTLFKAGVNWNTCTDKVGKGPAWHSVSLRGQCLSLTKEGQSSVIIICLKSMAPLERSGT